MVGWKRVEVEGKIGAVREGGEIWQAQSSAAAAVVVGVTSTVVE